MLDLTDIKTIRSLLTYYNVAANKQLGQHFLIDKEALLAMVASANITEADYIVEIGPGFGVLTFPLTQKAGRVLAIETDKKILEILKGLGGTVANLEILESSILTLNSKYLYDKYQEWAKIKTGKTHYKIVSNLPYYITSSIIKLLLEGENKPELISIMVQKEVAERITAEPGEMSILAISVQIFGAAEIVRIVPAKSFWPAPQVDSAILRITPYQKPKYPIDDLKKFFRVVKAGFGEKRKQLHNSLAGGLHIDDQDAIAHLDACGIDPKQRAQDLSIDQWIALHNRISPTL
jgi:16S rRNA (adenine1518-N6/adenine1519-N6)-dimethyltransferase